MRSFSNCAQPLRRQSSSSILHSNVLLHWLGRILHAVLILHVPPPVVLPRERFAAALLRVGAPGHCAVVLARFVVLVVDVPVQVRLGAESFVA